VISVCCRTSRTKVDFVNGGGPEKPVPQRYSESHQGVLSSTDYGASFRQRLGVPVSSLVRSGSGGGGGERLQQIQVARHSAGSNGGSGGAGTVPGLAPQPRGSEPGTSGGYVLPSDRAAIIRRTTPANPKERDAMRRIQPKFVVGRRNPITAEWAIADAQAGAVQVASSSSPIA
jgi:hypothetical protein